MKRKIISLLTCAVLACCIIAAGVASADEISFTGVVTSSKAATLFAPIGGTVESVCMNAGDRADEDSVILTLKTTPVYATESGTVHYFGQVGDSCENVAGKYGAVACVEPDSKFTISSSTRNGYDSEENKWIVPGEKVYLKSTQESSRVGEGIVSNVTGSNYTVVVTDCGQLQINDSVNIFRMSDYTASSRIGRSNVTKVDPVTYAGEGSIAAFCAEEGAHVEKGDVLFETLPGTFSGYKFTGTQVILPAHSTISEINVKEGDTISKDQAIAACYPDDAICVEATISEGDLPYLADGMDVELEFSTAFLQPVKLNGSISSISYVGTAGEEDESKYTVRIAFTPTDEIRYGMHCVVSTIADVTPEE